MMKEEVGIRVQTQMVILRVLCTRYMVLSTLYNVPPAIFFSLFIFLFPE